MYARVLLAFDGTVEGRAALREGALLAARFRSHVLLLAIVPDSTAVRVAESVHGEAIAAQRASYGDILEYGLEKLRALGVAAESKLQFGEPAALIGEEAVRFRSDLVVVGHKRQGALARWWSGPSGAYLIDHIPCSLLVGRNIVSDDAFQAEIRRSARDRGPPSTAGETASTPA